jgi:Glyoxalase/Bleomycin resistance protein/Dioxygenase superfamily
VRKLTNCLPAASCGTIRQATGVVYWHLRVAIRVVSMKQSIGQVAVVVRDYDEAIDFYLHRLGFSLIEDTPMEAQNRNSRRHGTPANAGSQPAVS